MIVHSWSDRDEVRFTFLDNQERVAVLPTAFIKFKSRKLAIKSRETYASRTKFFCSFLESHPALGQVRVDVALRVLSLRVVEDFYHQLERQGLSSSTVRGYEITVKEFCKWLANSHSGQALNNNPYKGIKFITKKPSTRLPSLINVESVICLIKVMNFEEHRLIGHFIYDTGLRISEVPRVLKSEIPDPILYPRDTMYFPLFVAGSKGPGDQFKPRITIITRAVLSRIHKYHSSKHYLINYRRHAIQSRNKHGEDFPAFLNTEGNPINKDAIEGFLSDASVRADIKISAHRLRHGTAYSVLRSEHGNNMLDNLIVAQKLLGHADLSTTEIYTRVPAAALIRSSVNKENDPVIFRFEESQRIFDETYMPDRAHQRKRRKTGGQNERAD